MRMCSNVHTHSTWCDGENTPKEMVEQALRLGFTDLGFSSHSPAAFDPTCPGVADEGAYRADIERLKVEYAGKIGILCGIEWDAMSSMDPANYDYVIATNHYLKTEDGTYISMDAALDRMAAYIQSAFGGDTATFARAYYGAVLGHVAGHRPSIVGHFDIIKKYNTGNRVFSEESQGYKNAALEAFDAVLEVLKGYGGMVEVNTGGMIRGWRDEPYPAPFLLRHAAQKNARVIITSDCHTADSLDGYFEQALGFVRKAGFKTMAVLQNGAFEDVAL